MNAKKTCQKSSLPSLLLLNVNTMFEKIADDVIRQKKCNLKRKGATRNHQMFKKLATSAVQLNLIKALLVKSLFHQKQVEIKGSIPAQKSI